MKDTIITARQKKYELKIFILCFIVACLLNVYAIITYEKSFSELYTSIGYVAVFSVILYLFSVFIRLIFYYLKKLYKHRKK